MNPETEFREGLDELAEHYTEILKLLGEDPEREGLLKTPMRVAKAMQILTRGYTQDARISSVKHKNGSPLRNAYAGGEFSAGKRYRVAVLARIFDC